jgi:hypothetical protein
MNEPAPLGTDSDVMIRSGVFAVLLVVAVAACATQTATNRCELGRISVLGGVGRPGRYPISCALTLGEALERAEVIGTPPIVVLRIDGRNMTRFRVPDPTSGRTLPLRAGDIVVVADFRSETPKR